MTFFVFICLNSNTQTQSVLTDAHEVKEDLWQMTVPIKHKKSLDITPTFKMSTICGENGDVCRHVEGGDKWTNTHAT